jgi:hypothetical protein
MGVADNILDGLAGLLASVDQRIPATGESNGLQTKWNELVNEVCDLREAQDVTYALPHGTEGALVIADIGWRAPGGDGHPFAVSESLHCFLVPK